MWMEKTWFGSTGHMRENAYHRSLKWTFEDLLPCYCYAIKTNSRKTASKFRNLPLQAMERIWVNCNLIMA